MAITFFEEAKRLRPKEKMPYMRLCAVYKVLGNADAALPNCKRWLVLERDDFVRSQIERTIIQLKAHR